MIKKGRVYRLEFRDSDLVWSLERYYRIYRTKKANRRRG